MCGVEDFQIVKKFLKNSLLSCNLKSVRIRLQFKKYRELFDKYSTVNGGTSYSFISLWIYCET